MILWRTNTQRREKWSCGNPGTTHPHLSSETRKYGDRFHCKSEKHTRFCFREMNEQDENRSYEKLTVPGTKEEPRALSASSLLGSLKALPSPRSGGR